MALKSEQLPNRMLNGEEVRHIAVQQFDQMLSRDCVFLRQQAYRRCALKLTAVFEFSYPVGSHPVELRGSGELAAQIPLPQVEGEETAVKALERTYDLDNPNLQRVHHGLPIVVTERKPPEPIVPSPLIPGEPPEGVLNPYPTVIEHELRYHPTDFPQPAGPVDADVTDREAAALGVKPVPVRVRTAKK